MIKEMWREFKKTHENDSSELSFKLTGHTEAFEKERSIALSIDTKKIIEVQNDISLRLKGAQIDTWFSASVHADRGVAGGPEPYLSVKFYVYKKRSLKRRIRMAWNAGIESLKVKA